MAIFAIFPVSTVASLPLETAQLDQDSLETSRSSHIQAIGGWSVIYESARMLVLRHRAYLRTLYIQRPLIYIYL